MRISSGIGSVIGASRAGARLSSLLCLLVVATIVLLAPRAQAQTTMASVSGHVADQSGGAVPGADVQITNADTHIGVSAKTNADGIYVIPSLKPGNYVMKVSKAGFRTVTIANMTLNVQENLSRDFALQVGSTTESITVTAEAGAELIQNTSSDLGTVINQKAIHELPLNGRSFSQLLTLTPGATPISTSQS